MLGLDSFVDSPRWGTRFRRHANKGGSSGGKSGGGSGSGSGGGSSKNSGSSASSSSSKPSSSSSSSSSSGGKGGSAAASPQKAAQDLLAKFGASVSAKEATKAQAQGITLDQLKSAAKAADVQVKPGAKSVYSSSTKSPYPGLTFDAATTFAPGVTVGAGTGDKTVSTSDTTITDTGDKTTKTDDNLVTIPELNTIIAGITGAIDTEKAKLAAEASKYESDKAVERANIAAGASQFESEQATKRLLEATQIEVKGKLDLQPIINAGLKDVADISGQYNVKQEETRQAGQRDLARIGMRSNILQGLVGAFNF